MFHTNELAPEVQAIPGDGNDWMAPRNVQDPHFHFGMNLIVAPVTCFLAWQLKVRGLESRVSPLAFDLMLVLFFSSSSS